MSSGKILTEVTSVAVSNGRRRRWVMVDDVDRRGRRVDLADWRRCVLLHNRQWVVARIARGARIAWISRSAGISRICRVARIWVPADAWLGAVRQTAAAARLESWLARARLDRSRPVQLLLTLRHVELVLLPLVPLLVLERHLLEARLRLGIGARPASAQLLRAIPNSHPRVKCSHFAPLLVGEPHETGDVPLRSVRVFLRPRSSPPARVGLHHVLLLFSLESVFILSRHLVVLCSDVWWSLGPPLSKLLPQLPDACVGHQLAHLHPLLVREHHEAAEGSLGRVRVLLGSCLLVASLRTHVVLGLLLAEPLLVVVSHLLKHRPGHLVQGVPPPAQLLRDVRHREVGVRRLDLRPTHVGEVEEARERSFRSIRVPMRLL